LWWFVLESYDDVRPSGCEMKAKDITYDATIAGTTKNARVSTGLVQVEKPFG